MVALERARYRIARLGVFEAVDLRYEPEEGSVRDPVFKVREAPRYETNLLMGYGSYEQFRGGVEYRQMNILGSAHQSRLELVQSMKSTSGDYTYTVPELFGESLDGTARLFGLQRRGDRFPAAGVWCECRVETARAADRRRSDGRLHVSAHYANRRQLAFDAGDRRSATERRQRERRPHGRPAGQSAAAAAWLSLVRATRSGGSDSSAASPRISGSNSPAPITRAGARAGGFTLG